MLFVFGLGITPVSAIDENYAQGRQWAIANNVVDQDFHSDMSESFDNGVREYALERQQQQLQDNKDIQPDD